MAAATANAGEAPNLPEGFVFVDDGDLLPEPGDGRPNARLCVATARASRANGRAIVDIALVYGPAPGVLRDSPIFSMGGGYETTFLDQSVSDAYGSQLALCVKREGAGRAHAEAAAARAAARAAAAVSDETQDEATVGTRASLATGGDDDDELLDTTLTPEQVAQLEAQRAERLREAERRARDEAAAREAEARKERLAEELEGLKRAKAELLSDNGELQKSLAEFLSRRDARDDARKAAPHAPEAPAPAHEAEKQQRRAARGTDSALVRRAAGRPPRLASRPAPRPRRGSGTRSPRERGSSRRAPAERPVAPGERSSVRGRRRRDDDDAPGRYSDALSAILDAKRKAASSKEQHDRIAFELQTRLDEKEFKAKNRAVTKHAPVPSRCSCFVRSVGAGHCS